MADNEDPFEFYFQEMAVGYFQEDAPPITAGRYKYMPYRGPGHYDMQTALSSGERPYCTMGKLGFTVQECPEYGVLVLSEFVHKESAE